MEFGAQLLDWFTAPAQWTGASGIPARVLEHLLYTVAATTLATAVGLPIGLAVGHTGRGGTVAVNITNVGRAIPSFGIIVLFFFVFGIDPVPAVIMLVALALPPIVTNTYVGVRSVPPAVTDSAAGMGLTGWQVLRQVEIPVAMPLIMAGIRTAAVQVVATATLAAYIGLGGLGRYIFDGLSQQVLNQVVGGAILVALLSLATEVALSRVQRLVVSEGLRARSREAAVDAKLA